MRQHRRPDGTWYKPDPKKVKRFKSLFAGYALDLWEFDHREPPNGLLRFNNKMIVRESNDPQEPGKEILPLLKALYVDPRKGSSMGRDKFYRLVRSLYIGISRTDVMQYLANQESRQIHAPIPAAEVVQPIVEEKPLMRFQIDWIGPFKREEAGKTTDFEKHAKNIAVHPTFSHSPTPHPLTQQTRMPHYSV
jgi:hypothetical protein